MSDDESDIKRKTTQVNVVDEDKEEAHGTEDPGENEDDTKSEDSESDQKESYDDFLFQEETLNQKVWLSKFFWISIFWFLFDIILFFFELKKIEKEKMKIILQIKWTQKTNKYVQLIF